MEKLKKNRFLLVVFGINFALAFLSLIFFIVKGGGVLTLTDDFNAQEIPFNMLTNTAIKSGDVFWNWNIDIGSDFVETFSFYNLGSPFFWITLLFPASVFPYLTGWVYMLKYAFAGLFSYLYIHRFVKNKNTALIGSMLYAFSGFQCCNLVFYHFHDAVALFPLLLIGLEKLQTEKKKGWFAFGIFMNALVNYIFFVGEAIFVIVYYIVRFMLPQYCEAKDRRVWFKSECAKVGRCIAEGVLGVCMAGILFVPSILSVLQNTRVSEHIMGSEALTYNTVEFLTILKGLFFPGESMKSQAAVSYSNWYSVSAYLPLVGMFLVLVYVLNKKKDWICNLLKVCFVMALVPLLNNMFVMFQREYYRRWYFMPVLIMAMASALVLEKRQEFRMKKPFLITVGIMAAYLAYMTLYPWEWSSDLKSGIFRNLVFAVSMLLGFGGVLLTAGILKYVQKHFMIVMTVATALFCCVTTVFAVLLYQHDNTFESAQAAYDDIVKTGEELDSDILPYRYLIYDAYNNRNMAGYVPGRSSFNSTVHTSIFEFYDALGEYRHTLSPEGPEGTNEILSVGYYVMADPWPDEVYQTFNNGYRDIYVYHDEKALPIGFTYDTYITKSEFSQIEKSNRAMAMLKTLVVADEDEEKVSGVLRKYDAETDGAYTLDLREEIKAVHKKESSENFWNNSRGFGSTIVTDGAKYAFYSVPYSKSWSAQVNGQDAEILNINGLMAVRVDAGENTITFSYCNKGLYGGIILSVLGFIVWIGYIVYNRKRKEGNQ